MRRFMVRLVTEIDFVDGAPSTSRCGRSRASGPRAFRSQKSRMNSNARLQAHDARQHALERRPLCHRVVRQLRPLGRRQRRSAAGDPDSPRDRQTPPLQQLRRQNDIDPPRLAYEPAFLTIGANGRRCPRCFVPDFDGAFLSNDSKDALWDRFYTGAPQRQSGCVPRQAFRGRHGV
jgi:hypothetical protein